GEKAIYLVGIATAVGFLLQFLLLVPAMAYLGIRYRPLLRFDHPAIAKLVRVGGPLLLYLVVANGSLFLERNLASRLATGAVSTPTSALTHVVVASTFPGA